MKSKIKQFLVLICSSFLIALAVNFFIGVHNLTPGGTTGMAISLSILTGIEIASASLWITVPLIIIGAIFLGQNYGIKTLVIVFVAPFFMSLMPMQELFTNPLISGVFGGILVGLAISFAISIKCSTGGTDLIAMLLNKFIPKVKISNWLLLVDGLVVISSAALTGELTLALYSAITLLVINVTIKITLSKLGVE